MHIRTAWIGTILHAPWGHGTDLPSIGVLHKFNWYNVLWARLTGTVSHKDGYMVHAADAVQALNARDPVAAAWWMENTPHMFAGDQGLLFDTDCCTEISKPRAYNPANQDAPPNSA